MAEPARRYVPEPLNYAVRVLESVCSDKQSPLSRNPNPPFTSAAEWLNLSRTAQHATSAAEKVEPLKLSEVLPLAPEDAYFGSRAFQCSVIASAVELASRAAELYADLAAAPEALGPAQQALSHVAGFATLPQASHSAMCLGTHADVSFLALANHLRQNLLCRLYNHIDLYR